MMPQAVSVKTEGHRTTAAKSSNGVNGAGGLKRKTLGGGFPGGGDLGHRWRRRWAKRTRRRGGAIYSMGRRARARHRRAERAE